MSTAFRPMPYSVAEPPAFHTDRRTRCRSYTWIDSPYYLYVL
jgi:hypothetical protein